MASSIESNIEVYSKLTEYSQEDISKVCQWEDEEQQRRIADILGEEQRRANALLVTEIISTNLRPNWFQQGSSFVFNIIKVAREAGNKALSSSQIKDISTKLKLAGQKGAATAQDVKAIVSNKAQHTAQDAKLKLQETSQDVKLKLQGTSQDVKLRLQGTSQDVKLKLQGTSQDVKLKLQGTAQDVKVKAQEKIDSAQNVAHNGLGKVQEAAQQGIVKVHGAAKLVRGASLKLIGRVSKAFSNLSENSNLAFAVLEEENERAWRMGNDNEVFAVLNALRVSSLFKDTAPALYRPAFEPTRKYSTRLLEENERSRRALEGLSDSTAKTNAKAVAGLITERFRIIVTPFPAKAKHIEEIHVTKAPIPTSYAAM